jgi:ATPase subunit of ABC transporter with duplicated ATPase domains
LLANISLKNQHLLLLYEPSNHLDIETVEALPKGLAIFEGGVFVIRGVGFTPKFVKKEDNVRV